MQDFFLLFAERNFLCSPTARLHSFSFLEQDLFAKCVGFKLVYLFLLKMSCMISLISEIEKLSVAQRNMTFEQIHRIISDIRGCASELSCQCSEGNLEYSNP